MMKMLHSYWAYLVLIILVIAVINAIIGLTSKKEFTDKDLRISLFALIVTHIQLVLGLVWYVVGGWHKNIDMKNASVRLLTVEHPLMMVLGIVLITIGWSRHKKQTTDTGKFKTISIFYGLGLLFFLSRIPWSQWLA